MNKKANTILFILGATVFNLVVMAILFFVPLLVLLLILKERLGNFFGILTLLLFFAALVGSFFIYGFVMKKISARVDMDKYFDPIFKKRKP
ncbi:MAG TPA: leader peptide processing enzyme [Spirochaetia bacterium]|nr:leader peptide processing enzyme [Spirochaetia bacterium]